MVVRIRIYKMLAIPCCDHFECDSSAIRDSELLALTLSTLAVKVTAKTFNIRIVNLLTAHIRNWKREFLFKRNKLLSSTIENSRFAKSVYIPEKFLDNS